eukprot:3700785-Ditylum_brightwellii.AAC.1
MQARARRLSAGTMGSSCKMAFADEREMLHGGRRMFSYDSRRGLEAGSSYLCRRVGATSSSCLAPLERRTVANRSAISSGVRPCKREASWLSAPPICPHKQY